MFRLYYHLYFGPSWRTVWQVHRQAIEQFALSGLLDRLVVCCAGPVGPEFGIDVPVEIRELSPSLIGVNEFHTLKEMHQDANHPGQQSPYFIYMHSKGSSAQSLDESGSEWSAFLCQSLLRSAPHFEHFVCKDYNCLGSNLALGIFEDFGPPRLHYSGNFWCATKAVVAAAPDIDLGSRASSIRHSAEWWLGLAPTFRPFNVFATGVNHYQPSGGKIDWERLSRNIAQLDRVNPSMSLSLLKIEFLRRMLMRATGNPRTRRMISRLVLASLPYHRWRKLFYAHDILMRYLGSRKSTYLYCAELS